MDDLYDNLENYNDVNIVEELKSENKELKLKLDEYSKTMAQLQKDFDKLNSEYKKLEINYSSLLKTARAEIQRKTEMINDLNLQKDMIIINTMKKTSKNFLKSTRSPYSREQVKNNEKSTEPVAPIQKQNKGESIDKNNQKDNRIDLLHTPSIGSICSRSTESKSVYSEEQPPKSIDYCDKSKNKENYSKVNIKDQSLRSGKIDISNRRKSLPASSYNEAKFSSDEDTEPKVVDNTKPLEKKCDDTKGYRIDSYERYDPQREPRSRLGKYTNHEKYSNVDKYNTFNKYRRNYSPDRSQSRYSKEYGDYSEHYPSRDYRKQTAPRSPPPDKYKRSKSRDWRYNYDQDRLDYYRDYENQSSRYYEHFTSKHKLRNEFDDEPSCKRQKIDTYGKYKTDANSINNEKEREVAERKNTVKSHEVIQNSTCQSPDHVNVDSSLPQHFVKEIMTTTATNLEDPRISSKKYILSLCNDTPVLSTVVGRNVDMKFVDTSVWGIEKINVPVPLTKPILGQENDDIIKDIYMDIEKPDLQESLESGEIENYDDEMPTFYSRDCDKDYDNDKNNKSSYTETQNDAKERGDDKKVSEKSNSKNFKIPIIKKPDKSNKEKDLEYQDICHVSQTNQSGEKHNKINENVENMSNKLKHYNEYSILENSDTNENMNEKRAQEIIRTIEGDLELSDEASDTDSHKNVSINETKTNTVNVYSASANNVNLKESNIDLVSHESEKTSDNRSHKIKSSTKKDATIDSLKESNRKSKIKKKSSEKTEANNKKQQNLSEINKFHEKKNQKEKECNEVVSMKTKNKFSDLFGDSSSLITPDDLGINNIQEQPTDKYTSIFENTQDAVDLSVEDIAKTSTSKSKLNTFDTVLDKLSNENPEATNTNNFNVNVTIVNDISENIVKNKNDPLSHVYENAKSETTANESSIVKTVIISSGIQPECEIENISKDVNKINTVPITTTTENAVLIKCQLNNIKALATSTPHKNILSDDISLINSVCTNTIASTDDVSVSSNLSSCSNNNSVELQNDDVPDVRIFVRRRRKVVKRAP